MVQKVEHSQNSQCPWACTLDIIGDHWTLLVIKEMMFMGHHQYKDILAMQEGISSNILSDRLKRLEESGVIASAYRPHNKRDKLYYLTDKGKGFIYVMIEILRWADLHIRAKIHVPDDIQPFLDSPPDEAARIVFRQLEEWEKENIS